MGVRSEQCCRQHFSYYIRLFEYSIAALHLTLTDDDLDSDIDDYIR